MTGLSEYQKAFIGPYINGHMELKDGFYVPFNPAEISVEEAIGTLDVSEVSAPERRNWMQKGRTMGMQHPVENSMLSHKKGMTTLSTTLFFNTLYDLYQTSYEDVREDIRRLYPYTNTLEKNRNMVHTARQIYFFWGTLAVAGMLSRMSVNYTMFSPDGKPVRAQVGISIEGFYVGEETAAKSPLPAKTGRSAEGELSGGLSGWKERYQGGPNPRLQL